MSEEDQTPFRRSRAKTFRYEEQDKGKETEQERKEIDPYIDKENDNFNY